MGGRVRPAGAAPTTFDPGLAAAALGPIPSMILDAERALRLVDASSSGRGKGGGPVNLRRFTTLTPDAARILARSYVGGAPLAESFGLARLEALSCELDLSGLTSLDTESAALLATWNPRPAGTSEDEVACALDLSGLREAPVPLLAALAAWTPAAASAVLRLDGLDSLDDGQAAALACWRGGEFWQDLRLGGVTSLSPAAAGDLARGVQALTLGFVELPLEMARMLGRGHLNELVLPELTRISAPALRALAGMSRPGSSEGDEGSADLRLVLGPSRGRLEGLNREFAEAAFTLRQRGVAVHLSPGSSRALSAFL